MHLVPEEEERLLVFLAAELARKRRAEGLKLSYPEAVALISDEIYEAAREGKSYDEVCNHARHILTTDEVLPGVEKLVSRILVDALFEDGTHLVAVHHPIHEATSVAESPVAGVRFAKEPIDSNVDRPVVELAVTNTLDRPVQVTSHYHFFEVNRGLQFDRTLAYGMHLDIPAGTSVRFEPGEAKTVRLVTIGGTREIYSHAGLVNGYLDAPGAKERAVAKALAQGYSMEEGK
jgi:urease subunit gamma/beta